MWDLIVSVPVHCLSFYFTHVHNQPTRENNMLDLVFTNNPSLVKTSISVPGISDHAMVVTDIDILLLYIKQKQRKYFIFSKEKWDDIFEDMNRLFEIILSAIRTGSSTVEELWGTFKTAIEESMNRNIPTKVCKKRKSVPWFNRDLRRMVRRNSRLYRMWDLIVSVPDHCLSVYFTVMQRRPNIGVPPRIF